MEENFETELIWMKYPENKPTRWMIIIKARKNYWYAPSYEIEYVMNGIENLAGWNMVFAWAEIPSVWAELLRYREQLFKISTEDYINKRNS